jgi:SulP family sulfate permease
MDMDYAMEFCENQILLQDDASAVIAPSFKSQLKRFFTPQQTERLMKYMEKENQKEFHILIHENTPPDSMYFIESGELAAHMEVSKGKFIRLRSMGPGAVVGEVGHYLNGKRTATVTVVKESVIYQLTRDSIRKMETEDTELAMRFHIWMSTLLSLKLSDNNKTIEALTK